MHVSTEILITNRRTLLSGQKDLSWRRAALPWAKAFYIYFDRNYVLLSYCYCVFFVITACYFELWKMLTTEHLIWKLGVSVTGQNYILENFNIMECTRSQRSGNAIFHHVSYFWGLLQSRFLFLKYKELCFWNGSQCKAFCENQLYLHENENSFSYHRLRN